jgi:hypothetical protein
LGPIDLGVLEQSEIWVGNHVHAATWHPEIRKYEYTVLTANGGRFMCLAETEELCTN